MQRREHEMAGKARLHGDLSSLEIADLADHDDVGILAQDRAQRARKVELDLGMDLCLRNAVQRKLDWILDRHHIQAAAVEAGHGRVQRRGLPRARRAGHQHDTVRLADQPVDRSKGGFAHAQSSEVEARGILVEKAQYDALTGSGRQRRHAHVDALVAELQRHAPVLRQALFGDVQARHHFEPRYQRRVQFFRRRRFLLQQPIHPVAQLEGSFEWH